MSLCVLVGIYCQNIPTHTPRSGYHRVTEVAKTATPSSPPPTSSAHPNKKPWGLGWQKRKMTATDVSHMPPTEVLLHGSCKYGRPSAHTTICLACLALWLAPPSLPYRDLPKQNLGADWELRAELTCMRMPLTRGWEHKADMHW